MMDYPSGLSGKYRKMSDEEKALYDKKKVKQIQFIPVLVFTILSVLAFIFDVFLPGIIPTNIFIICLVVDLVVLLMVHHRLQIS